jgi:type IV fimbrial biogenesis protein FimT
MKTLRTGRGFSLVESCVVLAIAAIMLSMAIPSLRTILRQQHLKTAVNDLFGAINLTRAQAIERGTRVELVPLDPAGRDWRAGWVVFVDRNANQRPDAGEEEIFRHGPVAPGIAISTALSSHPIPDYLAYNGAGRSCTATSSATAHFGTVSLFMDGQERRITINMLGRARVCDPAREGSSCGGSAE